jgi:hypothetical protein
MVTRVLYIDDEISQPPRTAKKIKELLHVPGEFIVDLQLPPKDFSDLSINLPDVLIVDLDLSTAHVGDEPISYFGSTLAAEMRMRNPSCPIVLVTRPQFLTTGGILQILEESADLDLILLKDDIIKEPERIRTKIESLSEGFKALNSVRNQEWQKVLNLMGANEDEGNILREAAPPITKGQWQVPNVARWIRNVVMDYPGILYDELTSATRLGISLDAFQTEPVQILMTPAKYTGVFSNYQKCWWRDRLFEIAQRLMVKHQIRGIPSQEFGKAFYAESEITLSPAISVYDKSVIADWVCYILKEPVKQQHSVVYYPDKRPSVMDKARVSFTAILTSPDFDESLVDADGYAIVKRLWEIE